MYNKYRSNLISRGFHPIPLAGKVPITKDFIKTESPMSSKFEHSNVGIVCGLEENPVYAIDIDITDAELSEAMYELIVHSSEDTVCRVGMPPKKLLVYCSDPGLTKKKSMIYDCGHVEILGYGQQFAAYGIHPDTKKPYFWDGIYGGLLDIDYKNLPFIAPEKIDKILKLCEEHIESKGFTAKKKDKPPNNSDFDPMDPLDIVAPLGVDTAKIEDMLSKLDPDCDRDQWFKIGAAVHHETSGDGFDLWDSWSSGGQKYKKEEMESQWLSFDRGFSGQPATAAYLLKLTKKGDKPKDIFSSLNWDVSRFVNDVPEIPMIIDGMIPKEIIGLLYSAGGVGKSTWIMYVSVMIALANEYKNVNVCGNRVHPGTVVIVSAEDPDNILNMRYIEILKAVAEQYFTDLATVRKIADKHIKIMSTCGNNAQLFSIRNSLLETTTNFQALTERLKTLDNLSMIVIDTKSRYSPSEGMGNVLATQEISLYEGMKNAIGASIMILHHTNKTSRDGSLSGSQAYRDATAIFDSIRNSWYLRRLKDKELKNEGVDESQSKRFLYLENSKNNYIEEHRPIIINRNGFEYTHKVLSPPKASIENIQDNYDECIELLQDDNKKVNQSQMVKMSGLGRRKTLDFIEWAIEMKLVEQETVGRSSIYYLSDTGLTYKLEVE